MDKQSLLRELSNESLRLAKEPNVTNNTESQFKILIEILTSATRLSSSKVLPPVNWLNLTNTLIKSRFGSQVERELIELVMSQIETSNSAFVLIKNYLIDTSYLNRLQVEL